MLALAALLHRLPEKEPSGDPLMQGAWMLRPLRGLASLISLIDRSPD